MFYLAGHAFFVDGERNDHGAMFPRLVQHGVGAFASILQVDRVDDSAPGRAFQRLGHHLRVGGIEYQRRIHAQAQLLDQRAHLFGLVDALRHCHLHIQDVGSAVGLVTRHIYDPLVIVVQQESLDLTAAG